MQKATPLILVLLLAVSAVVFSIRAKDDPRPLKVPAVSEVVTPPPTTKTDTTIAKSEPRPWPQDASDIAPDSTATFGTLPNGMRYIIYPNAEPPNRVSLRMHIAAGSLMESDEQRGLAHFLEHMVFNGTKNYTSADLVPRMQRLGISFGAHINAYTSFDETVYMLDLPDLSADTLNLGFTVMRDFADGALLDIKEIDKERGVILSEKISRDSVNYRLMQQQFSKILPDSLITRRFPIGEESVIMTAPRESFVDLYTRFYTPERTTFIVVGDIDPQAMKSTIEKTFSTMANPASPGADPDLGKLKQPEGLETAVFSDKEVASTDVSLSIVRPFVFKIDNRANRTERLQLEIAHSILSRRFDRLSKVEGTAVASGSASRYALFNSVELGSIEITAAGDRWKEAVPILEQEFRRALEFGFSDAELAEAKSNLLNAYEQQVKQKPTRKSEGIASVLASSVNDQIVFSDPATDLEIAQIALAEITATSSSAAFKTFWDTAGFHLILTTKEKPDGAEQDLAAIFEESRGTPVTPPAARAVQVFDYASFGKPGTVTSRTEVADLGITQLSLSNGIKINLKPTNFEVGKIHLLARIGSGKLTQPKDMPMLDSFSEAVFNGGGLGKHSNEDLKEILAGKNVGSALSIGEDSFSLAGSTTPADFPLQTQLMAATLTDPGFRPEGLWQFQKSIPVMYQQLKHTPAGPQQEMQAWLYGGDSRFTIAPMQKLSSYTMKDAKNWLLPELNNGYLELSIVGDFEIETILPQILSTFGALSPRAPEAAKLPAARQIQLPNAPAVQTFTYSSKVSQGIAFTIWKTSGIRGNQQEFRRLNLVGEIFGDRLREEIREKLGASYSPNAGASGSDAFENVGYIIGQSIGTPEDLQLLLNTMRDLADKFATEGATADELDRALKPLIGQLEKSSRDNGYWLTTVMSQSQQDPARLDLARGRDADYRSITLAEINSLAKKYLAAENALLISIKPAE